MDKKDIMYVVAAIGIILVIAIVIKPLANGQALHSALSFPTTTQAVTIGPTHVSPVSTPRVTTTPPTPVPTWDSQTKTIGLVDPGTYGISMNVALPGGTRINSTSVNKTTTIYATISGKYSATSQIITIPFPYWEIWYTVDPAAPLGGKGQNLILSTATGSKGSGSTGGTQPVIQGSFSITNPEFTIQVMDAEDPNRVVRTITPPGGLDSSLWTGAGDPRPWKEKFYEGARKYYFVITAHSLNSYKLDIRVPAAYIGKY
ncbi:MAG: hypothetical protein NTZ37_03420 [Methanoregula sp.]|nr:hypothetical protein [Methanoregula sp.]